MTMLKTPDMTFVPSSVQKSSEDDGWCVKLVASPEGEGTTSMLSLEGLTRGAGRPVLSRPELQGVGGAGLGGAFLIPSEQATRSRIREPAIRDPEVRPALRTYLQQQESADSNSLVIEELGLCQGAARIDLLTVSGVLHGYEIKSNRDRLTRLVSQAATYSRVLDRVTLVVCPQHFEPGVRSGSGSARFERPAQGSRDLPNAGRGRGPEPQRSGVRQDQGPSCRLYRRTPRAALRAYRHSTQAARRDEPPRFRPHQRVHSSRSARSCETLRSVASHGRRTEATAARVRVHDSANLPRRSGKWEDGREFPQSTFIRPLRETGPLKPSACDGRCDGDGSSARVEWRSN
ncbi:MAG: sce7726 family protein [Gammaproteobacteria bacterium]|nr:sce7726 family protein [Gemmatimonadales bacterium]MYA17939.1 sce7726 family protein [Gammaproteobacteria bacterium]MYC89281.1 sce7726 family protein [Candidatus Palauibacter denitrificans]MYJ75500.1 sce7726 family protein [Gammaproteobacteria bacterium]